MKKRLLAGLCIGAMLLSVVGCGKKNQDTESGELLRSGQIELNLEELVVSLADYKNLEIGLQSDYTSTEEDFDEIFGQVLAQGKHYEEITARDTIEKEDYVLVDYTGYNQGVAFERGSAENAFVWVSDNNGYIDGFTDGLVGVKVGETVTNDVTFPDPYPNNTELSGVTVQFEFVVHGIYTSSDLTAENITDQDVENNFYATYGTKTVTELKDYVTNYLNEYNEYNRYMDLIDGVKDYMLQNSEVTVPDEYLNLRVAEYEKQFEDRYVTDGDLDSFLQASYGKTYDEAHAEWTEFLVDTIKIEFIFERIAQLEGIEVPEDEYASYISSLISSYGYASQADMFAGFGNGNEEEGETYVRRLYMINAAIDKVAGWSTTYVIEQGSDAEETNAEETEAE